MACWIIVVDDDVTNLKMAGQILSKHNMRVTAVKSGKALLEYVEEHGFPELILLDINMPEMDGLTAAREIRATDRPDAKTIPIIALTANAFEDDVQRSLQAGLNAHLTKPVEPERLYEVLRQLIVRRAGKQ